MHTLQALSVDELKNLKPGTKLICLTDVHDREARLNKGQIYTFSGYNRFSDAEYARLRTVETGSWGWKLDRFRLYLAVNYNGPYNSFEMRRTR